MSNGLRSRVTLRPEAISFQKDETLPAEKTYSRDYSTEHVLGEGGMGRVVAARDQNLGRRVAIKELRNEVRGRSELWERFVREAQIGGQLEHPNIVPIYAFQFSPDGGPAFVMQLVDGESLATYIDRARANVQAKKAGVPTLKERLALLLPICDAISYAHGRSVLHRDLKPDNIMLGPHNVVLVTDWGIARVASDGEELAQDAASRAASIVNARTLDLSATSNAATALAPEGGASTPGSLKTELGSVLGTPQYMSPEQAHGLPVGPASDQYSLGLMLLELASLRTARSHENTAAAFAEAVLGQHGPHLHLDGKPLDPHLSAIIRRATQKEAVDRYPTVEAFADDVRAFTRDEEVSVLRDSRARKFLRALQKHPARSVGLGALVLLGLAGWAIWSTSNAARRSHWARDDAKALSRLSAAVLGEGRALERYLLDMDTNLVGLAQTVRLRINDARPLVASARVLGPRELGEASGVGLVRSPIDGVLRSYNEPVFVFAPNAGRGARTEAARLAADKHDLIELYLSSIDETAKKLPLERQHALMIENPKGIARQMVALESGLYLQFPGRPDLPTDFDARESDWYQQAIAAPGRRFLRPKYGPLGRVPRLAVTRPIDEGARRVGVVATGFWLASFVKALGEGGEPGLDAAFLAAGDGKEVASQELVASATHGEPDSLIPLSDVRSLALRAALEEKKDTGYVIDKNRLFVYTRLAVEDWVLVHEYPREKYLRLIH